MDRYAREVQLKRILEWIWATLQVRHALAVPLLVILGSQAASAANGSVAYTYDALGRVTTASYDTGVCLIYTYDANGNRLSQTVNVNTGDAPTWGSGVWGCFIWTPH
jgi:YD repeat-containing protein